MKRLLLYITTLILAVTAQAQHRVSYINETFDGTTMPSGWEIMDLGAGAWSVYISNRAGGTPNEMRLHYMPYFTGISRLVMPAIDLSGETSVTMQFKHCFDNYGGPHHLGIATTSDNGVTWNVAWQQEFVTSGVFEETHVVSTPDIGNSNVRFCIFYDGNNPNLNGWFFDDIKIFNLEQRDAFITGIESSNISDCGDKEIRFTIQNMGEETITSLEATYEIEGKEAITETFEATVESLQFEDFVFQQPTFLEPGEYNVEVTISKVNGQEDDDTSNNTATKNFKTAYSHTQRVPVLEHFSSSTCAPCAGVNEGMLELEAANLGRFSYIKYAMNGPGSGDPYYNQHAGTRRIYYGLTSIPQLYLDGIDRGFYALSQETLDQACNDPAYADIRGSFNINENTITVKIEVMSFVKMNNARLLVSVNEKETHNNTGTNGETEFHHIMMQMLNNANGTILNLEAGESATFEFTYDMSTTFVEEITDLEAVAFIQEPNSRYVYNSCWINEYTDIFPISPINLALDNNNDGTMTATWEAAENSHPDGYNVYINGELTERNTRNNTITFDIINNQYYVVEIEAIYGEYISVKAVSGMMASNTTSIDESLSSYRVFPNPTRDYINITANSVDNISIYDVMGTLIETINCKGKDHILINTSNYQSGVYFIQISQNNGICQTAKVVISK